MENHIAVKRLLSGVEDSHTEIEAINPCKKFKEIKTSPIDDGLIRLIIGHLQDIGYTSAADCLAQDSKLTRSSSSAKVLEQLITVEKWTECCKMLTEDPCSVVMVSDAAKNELLLLLHLQEYFDLILRGDYKAAVMFVRQNMKKFHQVRALLNLDIVGPILRSTKIAKMRLSHCCIRINFNFKKNFRGME